MLLIAKPGCFKVYTRCNHDKQQETECNVGNTQQSNITAFVRIIQEVFEPPFFANAEKYLQDHGCGIPDINDHVHPPVRDTHNSPEFWILS